jgi:RimJ/RimL family protein N-acetyltransferase
LRRSAFLETITPRQPIIGKKVILRPKDLEDAATDYQWRTDAELCRLDASQPLTNSFEEFLKWYREELRYIWQGCHFAIGTVDGKHIGNCSYFNIDEMKRDAEMGIMIGDKDHWDKGYGTDALCTSLKYVFSRSSMDSVHLKTLNWNYRAHACFEKCGFTYIGTMVSGEYHFLTMKINRDTFLSLNNPRNQL